MKKFSYLDYVWEICAVCVALQCGPSEAYDRFRADVKAGEAKEYNTGDVLIGFDFSEASKRYHEMAPTEKSDAIDGWVEFIDGVENKRRWRVLSDIFKNGDREAFDAIVNVSKNESGRW